MTNIAKYVAGFAVLFFASIMPVFSQSTPPSSNAVDFPAMMAAKVGQAEKRVEDKLEKYCDARIDKLESQFDAAEGRLEKRSENQFDIVKKLFENETGNFRWLVQFAMSMICMLVAIALFLFWRQDKSLKEMIEDRNAKAEKKIEEKIADLNLKADESLGKLDGKLDEFDKMKKHYKSALDENERLNRELKYLTAYLKKKVVWAFEKKDLDAASEIARIKNKGFEVRILEPGEEKRIDSTECDLLIYYYRNTPHAKERLGDIGEFLKGKNIPLIIYTYKCGITRIPEDHLGQLGVFDKYILANMPLTLESHFNSLIRI